MSQPNNFNYVKWGFIVTFIGSFATVLAIPQDVKCSTSLLAYNCPASQKDVDLITQSETGESLAGVKVQVIAIGIPETQITDNNGYAKVKIANKGEVRISLSKSDYPVQDFNINLVNDQNTVRIIRLKKSGQPDVSSVPTIPSVPVQPTTTLSPLAQIPKEIPWNETASELAGNVGQDFSYTCPPNGTIGGGIYGTDFYTSNSSICTAAVHASMINARDGGKVQIRIRPGEEFYNATIRNGVASERSGNHKGSFTFLKGGSPIASEQIQLIEWNETASDLHGKLGQDFTYICPQNGTVNNNVYGADIYTSGSSICSAAVHAGIISAKIGGKVKIMIHPGEKFYNGTTRNGVITSRYDNYPWSFKFIK